jgi:hypothetical protein
MRHLVLAFFGCLMLAGCTSSGQPGFFGQTCTTGILIAGCPDGAEIETVKPGVYSIAIASPFGKGVDNYGLQQGILEAQSFCDYLGQKVYITNDGTRPISGSSAEMANIVFQCLQPNDKRLSDPKAKSDGYITYAPS